MSPIYRGVALAFAIVGAFSANRPGTLGVGLIAIAILAWQTAARRAVLTFLLRVALPICVLLIVVWGFLVKGAPGHPLGSDFGAGVTYATTAALRIAVL